MGISFWLIAVILVVILIMVASYNKIIGNKNSVIRSWADVITYERQKNNILPKLEVVLKAYQEYEGDLQIKITELRSLINTIKNDEFNNQALKKIEDHTKSLIQGVRVALENYPALKTSTLTQNFMKEIATQQENIGAAITIFNKNVEEFNNSIETFPGHIINTHINKQHKIEPFVDQKAVDAFEYKLNLPKD